MAEERLNKFWNKFTYVLWNVRKETWMTTESLVFLWIFINSEKILLVEFGQQENDLLQRLYLSTSFIGQDFCLKLVEI